MVGGYSKGTSAPPSKFWKQALQDACTLFGSYFHCSYIYSEYTEDVPLKKLSFTKDDLYKAFELAKKLAEFREYSFEVPSAVFLMFDNISDYRYFLFSIPQ